MRPRPTSTARFSLPAFLLGTLAAFAGPTWAAASQDAKKPDQVYAKNRRTGAVSPVSGVVSENGLEEVKVTAGERERDIDSKLVVRIVFGDVPPSYREASMYFDRGDFENASAKFQLAAGDAATREVVQAAARLRGAESLMRLGSADSGAFERAATEAATFLADFPLNREVPSARMLQARATHLSGQAAGAADLYRLIFREAENETPSTGYTWSDCMRAGLRAGDAFLAAGDGDKARETFSALDGAVLRVLGTLDEDSPERDTLLSIQAQSNLGEGWSLLAAGNASQAKTFFRAKLSNAGPESLPALRFGSHLGLAESLLAEGEVRTAQLEFALVSALDHADRDRAARALVGLARCALKTSDGEARTDARRWLQTVTDHYGDTPAVRAAQEMLSSL
ncbi:MAG: hypothetical protein AAF682_07635 [Planctomycetota bacterium]